uniref:Integrator complex subunit 6-like beta-barrel domain-containing protein n=1 Tax=Pseudo-nitzschia australis TaxID=44445 RepID=A0A6U9Y3Q2_9STRA
MIVVFVIDTSPSMGKPLVESTSDHSNGNGNSMSRLDLAKMAVEEVARRLKKRVHEHNSHLQQLPPKLQESFHNIGLGFTQKHEYLLLSTAPQHASKPGTAICGAGGRLLVGFGADHYAGNYLMTGENTHGSGNNNGNAAVDQPIAPQSQQQHQYGIDSFQRELKRLKATDWTSTSSAGSSNRQKPFPEDGGGAMGLNAALSAGLQMMSRYRLKFKTTENFGMGRLPSSAILNPTIGGASTHALQPACLIIITDGACLRAPPSEGGGTLKVNSSALLRDFYQEPFRWDQRIFCLGVGGRESTTSSQFLHPHLRALCEVTGGSYMMLRSSTSGNGSLSNVSDTLVNLIAPKLPRQLPIPDPVSLLPYGQEQQKQNTLKRLDGGTFVNGGPVVTFQALEPDMNTGKAGTKYRAAIFNVPICHGDKSVSSVPSSGTSFGDDIPMFQPPVWCIPESFFPSKKLDTLPPRSAQPCLLFSRYPSRLGSKCFESSSVMKSLARLDQLVLANLKFIAPSATFGNHQSRFLKRDIYICKWISVEGKAVQGPTNPRDIDYCPVLVAGAGRPTLSDGEGNFLSIGILHVPPRAQNTISSSSSAAHLSTLTLLPPEPHVLLPLLIRAAEVEHRVLKKTAAINENNKESASIGFVQKHAAAASRTIHLDENWRNEFRAYLFRLPPYYQNALKRSLRSILPSSAHSLLNTDSNEGALVSQCFSKTCLQKIRNAEQMAKINNERLERQEAELRRRGMPTFDIPSRTDHHSQQQQSSRGNLSTETPKNTMTTIKYGQYDPRCPVESYLAALRQMPAPWRIPLTATSTTSSMKRDNEIASKVNKMSRNALDALGDLPSNCLMAYYESRRRWIFGGSGVSVRGLHVEGVNNDGSNVQHCGAKQDKSQESLLSFAGVGVSELNATTVSKMGDYRERLLWSRAPVVGYGANDATGVSATTSQNGAPVWSVDDDAMPIAFFDERTGAFVDSVQNRIRSRLFVNFGNRKIINNNAVERVVSIINVSKFCYSSPFSIQRQAGRLLNP